ncbi:hypothetical protein RB653_005012 [Dictyostelium firmibasis]|uniref:GPR180/TMEM145 transmembrane domain-containing protein n=1 Tax=Dictyostelium firmibasis TaxID=79012 RepID=A0AAN7U0K1_9MYCE
MLKQTSIFLTVFIAFLICNVTNGMVVKEKIDSSSNFVFLAKFCFSTVDGAQMAYSGSASNASTSIFIYNDWESEWGIGGNSKYSCLERTAASSPVTNSSQLSANSTKILFPEDHQRAHFWYVVAANCQGEVGEVDFTLTLLNGGGLWTRQFSYDEQGLEALYLVYFFVFLLLVAYTAFTAFKLFKTNSFHPMIKILSGVVLLEFLSVFVLLCNYGSYSHNGTGGKGAQGFGERWAISRVTIDEKRVVLGAMGVLTVLYFIMFVWIKAGENPAATTYMYDTVPGIILLVARSLAMLWFMWCGYNTYLEETHPAKRNFYTVFGVAFVAWFLVLPIICIIAAAVEPWVREKTVLAFYVTTNALALIGVSFLLSPSRSGEYLATATKTSSEEYSSITTKSYDESF